MKDSLFNEMTLQKMQKIRKIFLKFAVWILIAELVLGAFLILSGGWDVATGRIQGTFLILALILFVNVNNFIRIEKGDRAIQIFALIGFISNLIWGLFAFLLMWEIVPFHWTEEIMRTGYSGYSYSSTRYHMTLYAIIMLISAYAAAGGFWVSNIMSIKETIKLVKPLKITAIVCILYLWAFGMIMTPIEPEFEDVEKLYQLAGLAGLAFGITALAALIISRTNMKKDTEPKSAQFTPKTEAELRAEIEEKVRREMIEKEVRAKIEAERTNANSVALNNGEINDNNGREASNAGSDYSNTAQ